MKWIEAAQRGNVSELLNHFAEGQKVNAEDENGSTALAVAVENGQAKTVKELLMMGADPKSGGAPFFAIDANRADILRLLLEHGLNPNGSMRGMGSFIEKAVQVAARGGRGKDKDGCLKALLKAGADATKVQRAMEAVGLTDATPATAKAKSKGKPATGTKAKPKKAARPKGESDSIDAMPFESRRGTLPAWDYDTWTAMSLFAGGKNGIDGVTDALARSGATVHPDVTKAALSGKLARPRGRHMLIVKLRGHDWAPVHTGWGDEWTEALHQQVSRDAKARVIWCGHQDTAGATAFHLYDKGTLTIRFESVGSGDDETRFTSTSHPKNWWRQYDDESQMLQALVREQDAYVPKLYVYDESGKFAFEAIPQDTIEAAIVERIILVVYGSK